MKASDGEGLANHTSISRRFRYKPLLKLCLISQSIETKIIRDTIKRYWRLGCLRKRCPGFLF